MPSDIGNATNLYGFLTALVVSVAWVVVELRRRRNGKELEPSINQPHPNGKLATKADLELAIARHQEDCMVGRRIEARLDAMDGRLDRIEEKMDERFARLEDAIRELWRAQAERGR